MSITIEQVNRRDIALCAALIRESFLTVAEQFGLTAENCPTHGAFLTEERLAAEFDAGVTMFLARADGAPAGFVALECKGDQAYLEKLAVLPGDRHRGIGRTLVNRALDCARANGAHKVSIGIIEENAVLRRWYEALGFRHTGTKRFDHLPFTVGFMEIEGRSTRGRTIEGSIEMKDVKLGVGTFIVREEAQRDLFKVLSKLREIGYEGVELLGFFGKSPTEIRSMLDALDLVALGNHLPLTEFEKDADRALSDHREIGCPFLTISCPNDAVKRGEYAMLAGRMSAAARACVEAGITPLYHNHGFDVAGDRPFADFILDACAKDGLCFEPDVGWIAFTGKDPADSLIKYRSRCRVIHFKDIYADDLSKVGPESELSGVERDPARGGFAFRPTGYGIVNTPRLLPLALACDPAWLMVDHDLAYGRDSFADLKLSHDYMRALMSLQ